jgi:hypothetical protein
MIFCFAWPGVLLPPHTHIHTQHTHINNPFSIGMGVEVSPSATTSEKESSDEQGHTGLGMMKPAKRLNRAYNPLAFRVARIRLGVSVTVMMPTYVKYSSVSVM